MATKSFDDWVSQNRSQLEQDFVDANEDLFEEYCKNRFDGGRDNGD